MNQEKAIDYALVECPVWCSQLLFWLDTLSFPFAMFAWAKLDLNLAGLPIILSGFMVLLNGIGQSRAHDAGEERATGLTSRLTTKASRRAIAVLGATVTIAGIVILVWGLTVGAPSRLTF